MTQQRSILVISPDNTVSNAITAAVAALPNLSLHAETSGLAQMNGKAVQMASSHDLIVVQTNVDDESELRALAAISAGRKPGAMLVALADRSVQLSQVTALMAMGVDEVLPIPDGESDFTAQFARIGARRPRGNRIAAEVSGEGHIIAVAQARGGVGATTIAVNLADRLAVTKPMFGKAVRQKVALVDFDLQFGTVGTMLDLQDQNTLLELALDGTIPDSAFLDQAMSHTASGVAVLAAPNKFAPLDSLRADQVAAILDALKRKYDYVIVDLPRALVGWIEPIVTRADRIVIVTDTSVPAVRHCRRLIDFFTTDNPALPIEIVVNRETRSRFAGAAQREAARALDRKIGHWLPDDPRHARSAIDQGKPLSATAPNAPLSKALARLALATRVALPVLAQLRPSK